MSGKVKDKVSKTARKSVGKKEAAEESAASKLIRLSGHDGHLVSNNVTGRADCGARITGWRYGLIGDVTCGGCLVPEQEATV